MHEISVACELHSTRVVGLCAKQGAACPVIKACRIFEGVCHCVFVGHVREREAWEAWSLLPALVVLAAAAAPTWLAAETASTQLGPCGPLVHHSVMALVCEEVHKALHAAGAQVLGVPTGPQVLRGRDSRAMLQGMLAAAAHCHGRAGSDGGATSVGRAVTHVQAEPGGSCAVQAQAGAPRWSDMMGWAAGFGRSS